MDFFRAFFGIIITFAMAFMLGWVDHDKNPVAHAYLWIGSIVFLILLRFFL